MDQPTKSLWRFLCLPALCVTAGMLLPVFATAEGAPLPSGTFVVVPAKIEATLVSGESKESVINLSNGTQAPLHVEVTFEDIAPSSQASAVDEPVRLLGDENGTHSLKKLLSTPSTSFDILSGKEMRVPISVMIPKSAEAGGLFGAVVFTFRPALVSPTQTNSNVSLESRVATLFFVRVGGNAKEEGRIAAFGLFNNAKTTQSPTEEDPLRFQVSFENTGDVHLNPHGIISISDLLKGEKKIIVDPWVVLPGATRMRELDLNEGLTLGYHTALLSLSPGYGTAIETKEVSFVVLPTMKGWAIIVLGFLFLSLLVRRSLQLSRHLHS